MFEGITIIVAASIILAVMGIVAKHVINDKIHPEKKDIVLKEICEQKHKGFEDCIEGKINALDVKFDTFRQDVKDEFMEVKELIRET